MDNYFRAAHSAPHIMKRPFTDERHGIKREDPFAWLKDTNWQAVMKNPTALNPEIKAILDAENSFCDATMSSYADVQERIYAEMRGRIKENETSPTAVWGNYAWLRKYVKGGEHPVICRSDRDGKNVTAIIDGNREAEDKAYFKIGATSPSPDHTRLAWAVDVKGSEYFTIKIRDISTTTDLPDCLIDTSSSMAWSADAHHLFYVQIDKNHRPSKVMRHRLGTSVATDKCIYEEVDSGFFVDLSASRSGVYIFINIHDHETSEVRLINALAPDTEPRVMKPRQTGIKYEIDHDAARKRFTIVTNYGGAVDFQIMCAPETSLADWSCLQPHLAGSLLLDAIPYKNHLAILSRVEALPRISVMSYASGKTQVLEFDEAVYALDIEAGFEYDTAQMRFSYSSMATPKQVFDCHMENDERVLVHERIVPSGHRREDYICQRRWATAKDGAKIPISLLMHKDTPRDGTAPVLLYGYGSYGITIPAGFSGNRLSLVDRGFIYAIAHIRGSKAMGHDWFLQGRGKVKKNTFTDFIAAAEFLIEERLTMKGNISVHGGSAGGLLVGAALNLAPDLFKSGVAEVPFVDTLNTMLDETLPLTPPEWPEWGNPISSGEDYAIISDYAPYENIRACGYPHILATGGLTDPRVTYWEPTKWVARLRDMRTDDGLTLLRMEMEAGHGGKAGRYNQLDELSFVYSFVLAAHGMGN